MDAPSPGLPPGLVIRLALPSDRSAILWLMRQLWEDSHQGQRDDPAIDATLVRYYKQITNSEAAHLLIALIGNSPAGMAVLTLRDHHQSALVTDIFIDPTYRRRGYARALIQRMEEMATRQEQDSIEITVDRDNDAARALYQSAGYRDEGTALHKKL